MNLRGYDLDARPLTPGAVMDRFLRAFGIGGERIPEDLDERAGLLRTVIGKRQVLLVLDNARVIDQVRPLLPGSGTCCVIVTSRDPLGDLAPREGASVIHLEVLGRDGADQIRYRFHDLVRLYARECAHAEEAAGDRVAAITRAPSCWLALAEEAHQREYGGAFTQLHGSVPRWRPADSVEDDIEVIRCDRLGGLIHEYVRAA
ncbi:hypothetical protein [Streptosporangium sp. LJ11]|uniref:hypothetical protein n=1 Tax=Streptosporangium sp. LJ11 TaxID=3436927 RepID=UPI003F78C683